MTNYIFILILIILFVILYFHNNKENFDINNNIIILETDYYVFVNIKYNFSYKVIKINKSLL
jgi:hypothetical protein